jgi:hypothetical protein
MKPPLPHSESAVPRTSHARLEIAKAMRMLMAPDEAELLYHRRAEIAAMRGELEAIKRDFQKAGEECLALVKAELRAALAKKYNPDQPRVLAGNRDGGQWTDGTGGVSPSHHQGVRYAGTAVEIDASALTGIDNIDETTKRLAKILARSVDEVGHVPGAARYGTAVHVAFEFNVFFEGIRGIGPGDIEPSFSLPPGYPSAKTTVRPDVVLRNDIGDIIAIYDVKTGDEGLDRARRAEFRAATGVDRTVPIIELRVCNDPIDCTYAKTWWD